MSHGIGSQKKCACVCRVRFGLYLGSIKAIHSPSFLNTVFLRTTKTSSPRMETPSWRASMGLVHQEVRQLDLSRVALSRVAPEDHQACMGPPPKFLCTPQKQDSNPDDTTSSCPCSYPGFNSQSKLHYFLWLAYKL